MLMFKGRPVNYYQIDGVDPRDYPDFCDAHFCYAEYDDGTPLTDDELELLTLENYDVISEMAFDNCCAAADDLRDRMMDY
jgi:hypothetical protein